MAPLVQSGSRVKASVLPSPTAGSTGYGPPVAYPRPLDATEKALLLKVFEMTDAPQQEALRQQVEAGIAASGCDCPCPSLTLTVDRRKAQPVVHEGRLDLQVYYDTGAVMVWVDDGWLSNLETWWWSDVPLNVFPPLDELRRTPPD